MTKKEFKENITITGNKKDDIIIYIQARSLVKKVADWVRLDDKWQPLEFEWIEWLQQISKPVFFYRSINPNFRSIKRSDLCRFFLFCDMAGVELRCKMQRQGKFTKDEWKLITEHCKMVEWR